MPRRQQNQYTGFCTQLFPQSNCTCKLKRGKFIGKEEKDDDRNDKGFGLKPQEGNQCDPRLAWEMFHKIYHMYSDIKNKEETNAALLLTSMSDHEDINKVR